MNSSNSVSIVILNLDVTAAKYSMFTRDCSFKKLQRVKHLEICGVVIVLVSIICVCPEFLSCITGLDILDKTIFSNVTGG